jgi:hypothetical protein
MARQSARPGTAQGKARVHTIDGVAVYSRKDRRGRPSTVDAIDRDEQKIRTIADRLWRRGYGVMRQRSPRAGKVFYLLKATWTGPGEPPSNPFDAMTDTDDDGR